MPNTAVRRPSGNGGAIGRSVNTACFNTMPPPYVALPAGPRIENGRENVVTNPPKATGGQMGWQEDLKQLGEQLTSGEIPTAEYRTRSESVLAQADQEAADETQPTEKPKPHIPVSAAWEAPSG